MTPAAINALSVRGFDPIFGGRPVKRVIQRELETPLARALLSSEFQVGHNLFQVCLNLFLCLLMHAVLFRVSKLTQEILHIF
jgi:ATP-dependent Clp protease ATP-binding subunit ClpA